MYRIMTSDIFKSKAQVLVCPVGLFGAMDDNLSKTFQHLFPDLQGDYVKSCTHGAISQGGLYLHPTYPNEYVLCFPVRALSLGKVEMFFISRGLDQLIQLAAEMKLTSFAFPLMGGHSVDEPYRERILSLMSEKLLNAPFDSLVYWDK